MLRKFNHAEPCVCGSGKTVLQCCLRTVSPPSHPKTGSVNGRCFARALKDCADKIEPEFVFGEEVTSIILKGDIRVEGSALHEPGESPIVPVAETRTKLICKRHQTMMSGFDALGGRFVTALLSAYREPTDDPGTPSTTDHLFYGDDLERWFLKVICASLARGDVQSAQGVMSSWVPPIQWLQFLFERKVFPPGWGLYYPNNPGSVIEQQRALDFRVFTHADGSVGYAAVGLINLPFVLLLSDLAPSDMAQFRSQFLYRPPGIVFNCGLKRTILTLGWDGPSSGQGVILDIMRPNLN